MWICSLMIFLRFSSEQLEAAALQIVQVSAPTLFLLLFLWVLPIEFLMRSDMEIR
jgi:hypothetical protein